MRDGKDAASFWDEKYEEEDYYFGTQPNAWVKTVLDRLKSPSGTALIELACGEGRNSNYAASLGYKVLATDVSQRGLEKTQALARQNGNSVETRTFNVLDSSDVLMESYPVVVVTFLHFPRDLRPHFYKRLAELLSSGGHLIAEWYHPNQRHFGYTSGGPPDPEMMPTLSELEDSFHKEPFQVQDLAYTQATLDEGSGHSGLAALCRIHAVKDS